MEALSDMNGCTMTRRTSSLGGESQNQKLKVPTFGLLGLASACWKILTLVKITFEEDVRKPGLFLLWLAGQLPGLAQSGVNRSLVELVRTRDAFESLSWEVLWMAVIRMEQGAVQVILGPCFQLQFI